MCFENLRKVAVSCAARERDDGLTYLCGVKLGPGAKSYSK